MVSGERREGMTSSAEIGIMIAILDSWKQIRMKYFK